MNKNNKYQRYPFGFTIKTETQEYKYLYSDDTYDYVFNETDLNVYMIIHNIKNNE